MDKPPNFTEDLKNDKIDFERYLIETSLIGTPEYLSPETLIEGDSSPAVDLWALGCIIYLFFHGSTPFKDKTNNLIFNRIENIEYKIDENLNENAKDIIKKLLVKNPFERLGNLGNLNGKKELNQSFSSIASANASISQGSGSGLGLGINFSNLKSHGFFKGINWENLNNINPPFSTKKEKLLLNKIKNYSTNNLLIINNHFVEKCFISKSAGKLKVNKISNASHNNLNNLDHMNNLRLIEEDIDIDVANNNNKDNNCNYNYNIININSKDEIICFYGEENFDTEYVNLNKNCNMINKNIIKNDYIDSNNNNISNKNSKININIDKNKDKDNYKINDNDNDKSKEFEIFLNENKDKDINKDINKNKDKDKDYNNEMSKDQIVFEGK